MRVLNEYTIPGGGRIAVQGGAVIDRAAVLGLTLAFCFLPSAVCLMAFPVLMYLNRLVR